MSSPANSIYNDDTQSDDYTLPYEATNNAHPPVEEFADRVDDTPLTREEFMWMERLDHYVTNRMIAAAEELDHIKHLNESASMWTDFAIESAELIDQIQCGRPLTVREMYYNIMKKKRINLAALNYNDVVNCLANSHQGPPKDDQFFIQLAYMYQKDYLSMPIWENISNCDKKCEINPFLIMEN